MKKTIGLGRGLDALIDTSTINTDGGSSIGEIALEQIAVNPDQPRKQIDEEALNELCASIRTHGVICPITLRKMGEEQYMIIAGERRFRAAKLAGLTTIPAYIRTANDENSMEWALIENIQREDLNAIEVALAYQKLLEQYNYTQEVMAERIGKNRSTVTNYLRLLKLPAEIQMGLKEHKIEMGHARAILALDDPEKELELYKKVLKNRLSVRQVEDFVNKTRSEKKPQSTRNSYSEKEQSIGKRIGCKVKISNNKISFSCKSAEQLAKLIDGIESLNLKTE